VFGKYMEFETQHGGPKKVDALRQRVEEYLKDAFKKDSESGSENEASKDGSSSGSEMSN
jgi:hypothetical protein